MISAFGPQSEWYARTLGDLDAIVAQTEHIFAAYIEAVRRRERGETFYSMILVDDRRVATGYRIGAELLAQTPDYDMRRMTTDHLTYGRLVVNGKPISEQWAPEVDVERVFIELYALSDAILVRSWAEFARVNDMFARHYPLRPLRPVERILGSAIVPQVERVAPQRPGVVIWAPRRAAHEMALHLHGLEEYRGDVLCVTAGGPLPAYTAATFVQADDPRVNDALARASCVLCPEINDPSDAVAFARLGYGVVAPVTSGAHEFASNIVVWDALNPRFLFTQVAVASTRPAAVTVECGRPPVRPGRPERPAFIAELPLVSVITPTYNRPEELRKMLASLAAQTYPNFESIVVNDGGVAVDDVVADFPFARLIEQPANAGAIRAIAAGREHCRGTFISLLPDDDWFYPDHIERVMFAILRSGASVGHSSALLRYLERAEGGGWITVGYNASTFSETLAPSDSLITSTVGGSQMIVRSAVYDDIGWYNDTSIADNELHARMAPKYFYVFADHITFEFRDHAGGQGRAADFPTALRHMYEVLHPTPDRPVVNRIREDTLANIARRQPGQSPFPPTIHIRKPTNA